MGNFLEHFQSIDFNNMSTDSSSQVTIHKRNRGVEENISPSNSIESPPCIDLDNDLPKKKKYKIVPNSLTSPPPKACQPTPSTNLSTLNKPKVTATITTRPAMATAPTPTQMSAATELPKDRKDLLKFVSFVEF